MTTSTSRIPDGDPIARRWQRVSRRAFWDRQVDLDLWRARVSDGHPSYLPQSLEGMSPADFARLLGRDNFVARWPHIRERLPEQSAKHAPRFDAVWSLLATQTYNVKPLTKWFELPRRRRDVLLLIASQPGLSIYGIAKMIGLQYRRAHDHVYALIGDGFCRASPCVSNGRLSSRLYPY